MAICSPNNINCTWYISTSGGSYYTTQFGVSSDVPVPADYDGDGKSEIGVYRPASTNSGWHISMSSQNYTDYTSTGFGQAGDYLVQNNYDGDGRVDIAVWRPSNGTWYIRQSSRVGQADEARVVQWGQEGDTPVPAFYRR